MTNKFDSKLVRAALESGHEGMATYAISGVSLPFKSKGLTSVVTLVEYESGFIDVVDIESGEWRSEEIIEHCVDMQRRHNASLFAESNGPKEFLNQFAKTFGCDVNGIVASKWIWELSEGKLLSLLEGSMIAFPSIDGIPYSVECLRLVHEIIGRHGNSVSYSPRLEALVIALEGARLLRDRRTAKAWGDAVDSKATVDLPEAAMSSQVQMPESTVRALEPNESHAEAVAKEFGDKADDSFDKAAEVVRERMVTLISNCLRPDKYSMDLIRELRTDLARWKDLAMRQPSLAEYELRLEQIKNLESQIIELKRA